MSLKLNTASGGSITLQEAVTASNLTITVPAVTGTMLTTASTFGATGPAFSAYATSNQTASNATFTKCALNIEQFDTANCYDSSTNYRFTPTVAGYYQFSAKIYFSSNSNFTRVIGTFYKNGGSTGRFVDMSGSFGTNLLIVSGSELIYMNGSTDYVELYAYIAGSGTLYIGGPDANTTYFQASMVRAA